MHHLQQKFLAAVLESNRNQALSSKTQESDTQPSHLFQSRFQLINTCAGGFALNTSVHMENIKVLNGNFPFNKTHKISGFIVLHSDVYQVIL